MITRPLGLVNQKTDLALTAMLSSYYQVGEQGFTLARAGVFASKFPDHVAGTSVNRHCGSSLTAIQLAYGMIASDTMDVVIASGCEIMSKYPIGEKWGVTKQMCDEFAVASHQNAHQATAEGHFKNEIMPLKGLDKAGLAPTVEGRNRERPERRITTAMKEKGILFSFAGRAVHMLSTAGGKRAEHHLKICSGGCPVKGQGRL